MKRNMGARKREKRGPVLGNSNAGGSQSTPTSSSDEEMIKRNRVVQRRKSFIEIEKRQRSQDGAETPVGSGRGEKRKSTSAGLSSGQEMSSDGGGHGSDYENQRKQNKRFRRRLSKKLDDPRSSNASAVNMSYGNLNVSSMSPNVGSPSRPPMDKKTLQEIYSTCSALFQAHKITPQNAFSLKLVECLDEIIESDDFDKKNLPLLARTLEIGGKIYVCRVDCAHTLTIKLATEIAQNQNEEGPEPSNDAHDDGGEPGEGEDGNEGKKKARQRIKKRSRFIEENEVKLNTGFEDQSSKYATRRTSLKMKLHRNIDEELDFDYLSYFLKPGEVHPVHREDEHLALAGPGSVPDSHVNADEMQDIPWLPFHTLTEWDPSKFDLWGVPLSSNPLDFSSLQRPATCPSLAGDDFAYDPVNRPEEYPVAEVEGGPEQDSCAGCDDFGADDFHDAPVQPQMMMMNGTQGLAVDNLRSLDDLRRFFTSLKGVQLNMKSKYGWAGPVFLKPQRADVRKTGMGKNARQPARKKKLMVLDYEDVDWKDPANRFMDGGQSKTTVDDKTLEKWAATKTITPYCNPHNFMSYHEDEEEFRYPFDQPDYNDDYMLNVMRFFVDTNRNIFKLMEEEFRQGKDVLSQSNLGPAAAAGMAPDEGIPGPEMDIEAPRDYSDDSAGDILPAPEAEAGIGGVFEDFAAAGLNLSAMFPGSLGFDTNPMSKASEFDSVKFSKQPKPIDMHALKRFIRKILGERLELDEDGRATQDAETRLDLLTLVMELMRRVDSRMAKHMSLAIVVVGLMHVVADNKLFMVAGSGPDNPHIVCRGKLWKHQDHIPLVSSEDS